MSNVEIIFNANMWEEAIDKSVAYPEILKGLMQITNKLTNEKIFERLPHTSVVSFSYQVESFSIFCYEYTDTEYYIIFYPKTQTIKRIDITEITIKNEEDEK